MPFLVRTIERTKWEQNRPGSAKDVSADAITSCKTSQNALSLWEVAGDAEVDCAVLAIVATCDYLETKDFILLPSASVQAAGLRVEHTDGVTPVHDLAPTHRDVKGLTYESLGILADLVLASLRDNMVKRYTRLQLKTLINDAIAAGRLERERLKEHIRADL